MITYVGNFPSPPPLPAISLACKAPPSRGRKRKVITQNSPPLVPVLRGPATGGTEDGGGVRACPVLDTGRRGKQTGNGKQARKHYTGCACCLHLAMSQPAAKSASILNQ